MDEKYFRLVRQIAKETVYEVLEEELYDGLFSLLDAFEGGIASFKQHLAVKKGVSATSVAVAAVREETFACLKFEPMKGAKIGDYEVAYKEQNAEAQWMRAYNILKQSNATIGNRYHGEGYQYAYWLYSEGRIYRQRLSQQKQQQP
jgi:hypothetical protein